MNDKELSEAGQRMFGETTTNNEQRQVEDMIDAVQNVPEKTLHAAADNVENNPDLLDWLRQSGRVYNPAVIQAFAKEQTGSPMDTLRSVSPVFANEFAAYLRYPTTKIRS